MKKFLKIAFVIGIVIFLICLVKKLGILDFSTLNITEEQLANYSKYYFNQLELDEKEIYIKIDEAVKDKKEKIFLGFNKPDNLMDKVKKVVIAYFYDNPECYYISNEYIVATRDVKIFTFSTLKLNYLFDKESEINTLNMKLESAIDNMIKDNVKPEMTEFEKELAIHDALAEHVNYYEYKDINNIPAIKHTAYAALVEREAVCDGYSKAFKLLLDKVGINNVIVNGVIEDVPHAWNIVRLNNEYYHVDVTSNKLKQNNQKYIIHTYFNVADDEMEKTHILDGAFEHPKCNGKKYDYYTITESYIDYSDNLDEKLRMIISKQSSSKILEIKLDKRYYVQTVINSLYEQNFNNWRYNGMTRVSYNKLGNVYVFVK